ncbi:Uncharacterised protein [Raoultella terrigena]|nr:Uncharacterised protein [Raoultella terrigena]
MPHKGYICTIAVRNGAKVGEPRQTAEIVSSQTHSDDSAFDKVEYRR